MKKSLALVFVLLLFVFLSLANWFIRISEEVLRKRSEYAAAGIAEAFSQNFAQASLLVEQARDFLDVNNGNVEDFEKVSKLLFNKIEGVKSFQLRPEDGSVLTFPSNASLTYDSTDANYARESKKCVISGPYYFDDTEKYFIIYHPVFLSSGDQNYFWGFVLEQVLLSEIFKTSKLDGIISFDINFRIFKNTNLNRQIFICENFKGKIDNPIDHHFMLGQKLWTILLKPSFGWQPNKYICYVIAVILVLLLSALYYLVHSARSSNRTLKVQTETLKSVSFRERTLRNTYETALESASLFLWELNLEDGSAVLFNNPFTIEFSKKYNIPHVIPDLYNFIRSIISESDYAALDEVSSKIRSGEKKATAILNLKSGLQSSLCTIKIAYSVEFDEDGKPVRACGAGQDITEDSILHDAYYQELSFFHSYNDSELRTRLRFNLTKDLLLESSPQSHEISFTGYINNSFAPDEIKFDRSYILKKYVEGERNFVRVFFCKDLGEDGMWLRSDTRLLASPESGDIEMFLYIYDNTRKRNEQLIINRITSFVYEAICIVNVKSRLYKLFAANAGSVVQNETGSYLEFLDNMEYVTVALESKEKAEKAISLENICKELNNNNQFSYSISFVNEKGDRLRKMFQYCYLDDLKTRIIIFVSDVTDQYEQNLHQMHELRTALNNAEIANRAKSEFVSRISHDIRTPIGAIQNLTKFARQDIDVRDNLVRDLNRIDSSSQFLLSLINDVLDISKLDSGAVKLNPTPCSFKEYKEGICSIMEPMCAEKNQQFEISLSYENADIFPVVDKVRLNQITLNILSNAVKYTPEGGTIKYISKSTVSEDGGFNLCYQIVDNGIGMSKEFQKHMFEDFSQEYDNIHRPKGITGTGLGLSIVKKMITLMKGTIEIESDLGEGTSVTVSIPLRYVRKKDEENQEGVLIEDKDFHFDGKILISEDNAINAEIMIRILEKMCHNLVHVENGRQAVDTFLQSTENEYSLILMDIQMPVMDGYEATRLIRESGREDGKSVYIAAMTADAFEEAKQRALDAGVNSFLTKPINPDKLKILLQKVTTIKEEAVTDGK